MLVVITTYSDANELVLCIWNINNVLNMNLFYDTWNFKMFLVTGGDYGVTTTEFFDPSVGSWVISGAILPRPLYEARAANINGRLLIFGNYNQSQVLILSSNPNTQIPNIS